MRQGPKPAKSKGAKPPVARQAPKNEGAKVRDLAKRLAESLEREKAAGEILRVISSSPASVQPTFEAIARAAMSLCEADIGSLFRFDGQLIHVGAFHGTPQEVEASRRAFPQRPGHGSVTARAILAGTVVQIDDVSKDPEAADALRPFRTVLAVPMIRAGRPLGAITVARRVVRPFSDEQIELVKTFADQAVIAIENVRLFTELEARNRDLTEALEQQTATAEILGVISRSPTDLQPVLDAVAQNAARVCGASDALIRLIEGDVLRVVAHHGPLPGLDDRIPLNRGSATGRAISDRQTIHLHDLAAEATAEFPIGKSLQDRFGHRTVLAMPLLREGVAIGAILIRRQEVRPFSDKQIQLLQTFADQAVIAIENVRLFKELETSNRNLTEALEQQTTTAEILSAISRSPTELQPVLDTLIENACRLCRADKGFIYRVDGDDGYWAAACNAAPELMQFLAQNPVTRARNSVTGRVLLEQRTIHVHDVRADRDYNFVEGMGVRTTLGVPLLREGALLGVIIIYRHEVRPFSERQVELVKTFADQAVIAIENVRLFKELEARNRDLTESLDQQTATSEILRVIASSPTDVQPVFDTIVRSAVLLCGGGYGTAVRFDGELMHLAAGYNYTPEVAQALHEAFPMQPSPVMMSGRAILTGDVVQVEDAFEDPDYSQEVARAGGFRSMLAAPMLRDGRPIGAIVVNRGRPGRFSPTQIGLLKTFADQAVIAIENVRLFTELQARTQELTRSVGQLTALGEVGRAVSSTLDLETVLSTIVSRAIHLSGTDGGSVYEYDETTEEFSLRASRDLPEAYVEQVRDARPRKGEGAVGRVAQTREPVQIADIADATAYESRVRNILLQMGLRALLAVPLIAEDQLVGALIVMRRRGGTFAAEEVALLQTFATQSALAIQNARLFREIEDKSRQLEVASQHKSEFLANMSHELRTPLNAIIGFSEVLSERMFGELNEKQEEYLKDIYASGTHLLSLINDILDLSKIEAGRMDLELADFDLATALDNALMLIRERAGRRSLTLHKDVDAKVGQVRADERKIRQVVLNLLSNAIKFTPEGGRIAVAAAIRDGSVEISVSDTGVGIAPEDQDAIFEEFRQVGTADKKAEGTGLGLTLCQKFIELHGGKIWVKSQLGTGSTFTFTIPVRHGG